MIEDLTVYFLSHFVFSTCQHSVFKSYNYIVIHADCPLSPHVDMQSKSSVGE